ncbi:MAG: nucleotidyltransferase family protein [Chloroflexi bacterium]|nr:nucleotidyltransferase family protein [Chloroflexota bacterium]
MNKTAKTFDDFLNQLKEMLPALSKQYHVRSLEIFGSFLHGDEHENSDLDLLITFEQVPSLFRFVELENHLSDELGIKVDLVMKDSLKPAIAKYILQEAQPV